MACGGCREQMARVLGKLKDSRIPKGGHENRLKHTALLPYYDSLGGRNHARKEKTSPSDAERVSRKERARARVRRILKDQRSKGLR